MMLMELSLLRSLLYKYNYSYVIAMHCFNAISMSIVERKDTDHHFLFSEGEMVEYARHLSPCPYHHDLHTSSDRVISQDKEASHICHQGLFSKTVVWTA